MLVDGTTDESCTSTKILDIGHSDDGLQGSVYCRCAVSRILSDTENDLSLRQHLIIYGLLEL
jgi:hypothetical protein